MTLGTLKIISIYVDQLGVMGDNCDISMLLFLFLWERKSYNNGAFNVLWGYTIILSVDQDK